MTPRVTLAMPVYNGETFIEAAIGSILSQSFADFELIITDNASTDRTEAICERLARLDPRIRYVRNARNLGAAANYNHGYELGRGEFLKWCAHDDFISENYLECAVRALDQNPDAVLAYGPSQMVDAAGAPAPAESATLTGVDDPNSSLRFMRVVRTGGSCGAIFGVFRRDALARSLLHQPYYSSDRALLAEMALLGRFIFVNEITFYNRAHPARSMSLTDRAARRTWQNTSSTKTHALERLPLLKQLFEVAGRHRDEVSPLRTMLPLAAWTLAPRQLGSFSLEIVSLGAPGLAQVLRQAARPASGSKPLES
jgi:glycosyltransferase involved in cell wall biosynthesis